MKNENLVLIVCGWMYFVSMFGLKYSGMIKEGGQDKYGNLFWVRWVGMGMKWKGMLLPSRIWYCLVLFYQFLILKIILYFQLFKSFS